MKKKDFSMKKNNFSIALSSEKILFFKERIPFFIETRLPASRSSSDGPEGRFSFFHPKVKVQKTISLTSFVFWGLVGLKVLINFKSFQGKGGVD